MNIKSLVAAVRADPYLGRGTGSYMDETQTDAELEQEIREILEGSEYMPPMRNPTKAKVIRELTDMENLWREQDDERVFPQIIRRKA